jgi:hypothetical protein
VLGAVGEWEGLGGALGDEGPVLVGEPGDVGAGEVDPVGDVDGAGLVGAGRAPVPNRVTTVPPGANRTCAVQCAGARDTSMVAMTACEAPGASVPEVALRLT